MIARLALRSRSLAAREVLAEALTAGALTDGELLELALDRALPPQLCTTEQAETLGALALTWAGQARSEADLRAATGAYRQLRASRATGELTAGHHQVIAQTLFLTGQYATLAALLPWMRPLPRVVRDYLDIDLAHPYLGRDAADDRPAAVEPGPAHDEWVRLLSGPFRSEGLAGLSIAPTAAVPEPRHLFDMLGTVGGDEPSVGPGSVDGPTVTVIVPCFRPDEGLLTSVASLVGQTYGPLQVVLVDDASGPQSHDLFDQALALDSRIELLRLPRNGGSYLARNAALPRAHGDFVTVQDADDWSHPERIARQVALLTTDAGDGLPAASTSQAVRARDDLTHQWLGYPAIRENASSLMMRAEVVRQVGGFLAVRKGADSEYAERIAAQAGPVVDTGTPLAVTRLRSGSLSRGDFSYQWATPDRLAFKGCYRARLRAGSAAEPPVPLTFVTDLEPTGRVVDRLPVAYLADFAADPAEGGDHPAARLWRDGEPGRVAIWHLESPRDPTLVRSEMHDHWFDRIVAEQQWQALTRVEAVHVERLVVLDASVLLLAGDQPCAVTVERVEVGEPASDDERDAVGAVVQRWFGVEPSWQPTDLPTDPDQRADDPDEGADEPSTAAR